MQGGAVDVVIFIGSAYVMDDEDFINTFHRLKEAGFKRIIDFHGGYQDPKKIIKNFLILPLKESAILRKLFGKPPVDKGHIGKFHGYGRTRGALRRLYQKAGLIINKEISVEPYNYVAILHSEKG